MCGVLTLDLGNDSDIESWATFGLYGAEPSCERYSMLNKEWLELLVMFSLSHPANVTEGCFRWRSFCFSPRFPFLLAELRSIITIGFRFAIVVLLTDFSFLAFEVCLFLTVDGNPNWDGGGTSLSPIMLWPRALSEKADKVVCYCFIEFMYNFNRKIYCLT